MKVIVLGSAAGGGLPQWNCGCPPCRAARADRRLWNGQVSLAVSADGGRHWFLINASPDLRQQMLETPALHPDPAALRHSPLAGVILTNAEVDAIAGLLSLREGHRFAIHAHPRVLGILDANPIFDVLDRGRVPRRPLDLDRPCELMLPDGTPSGLMVEAFDVPGKVAWFLEQGPTVPPTEAGDTLGLTLWPRDGGPRIHVLTACAGVTPGLRARLAGADALFFDGTLWRDDEMIRAGLAPKTGQRMGHLSMSGPEGAIAGLEGLDIPLRVFVHINNSNPVHLPGSDERRAAEAAGWIIPKPGREFAP